eukprot:9489833-Pyramimonas_sp.AAC.1
MAEMLGGAAPWPMTLARARNLVAGSRHWQSIVTAGPSQRPRYWSSATTPNLARGGIHLRS